MDDGISVTASRKADEIPPSGALSMQCKNQRHQNEDRYRILDPMNETGRERFFAVFDGHGGDQCSEFLKETMHQRVRDSKSFGLDYEQSLVDGILSTEQDYLSLIHKKKGDNLLDCTSGTSGSCALVTLVVDDCLYVANVGDCRAVIAVRDEARALTRDHKASDPQEKDRVVKAGGFVRANRVFGLIAVTRSLGDFEYKLGDIEGTVISTPDTFTEKLTSDHRCLILACDGVWDVVSNRMAVDNVVQALDRGATGADAAKELVELALARGSKDDLTVVVVPLHAKAPVSDTTDS